MSSALWIAAQLALDFILLGLIVVVRLQQKKGQATNLSPQMTEAWQHLLKQMEELEARILEKSQEMDRELLSLKRICERAEKTLQKAALSPLGVENSLEAQELKDSAFTHFSSPIPRLEDLEKASEELPSSLTLDLKTVLREQLA